ncbi:immunoglobulin-like domain-containing receptor 1a [Hoplias malabaricus]|uniref:immunoglobulin-like domain-containing receptor 1a n=1 Tax=Hoplias malabaricus TaxID=27720 RepID=UPI0034630BF8
MARFLLTSLFFCCFLSGVLAVQVTVPFPQVSTTLFVPVTLNCDYTTSAPIQGVIVTWRFKSFCLDPVLQYYSTAYQAAQQLGQDPSNDCPDSQRKVRIVAQKHGTNQATLGPEYQNRKITIQNNADLWIGEVKWWDNGVYFCSVEAAGDTSGGGDKFVKLIVYNWLTVLLIIIGAILLIILFGVCCCQCCPQRCCCYVRCPCCPQTCCCPEKAVMEYRMIKEAQKAMNPWAHGQPIYAPLSNHSSYQMNPLLYAGSASGKIPMSPLPLPPPQPVPMPVAMPPPSIHGNGSAHGANHMLDYLENQVRGMDMTSPLLQPQPALQQIPPPPQHMPQNVPFSAGPPSMLSGLDDGPAHRRPPGARPPSGSSGYGRHYPPQSGRSIPRSYSQEDILDNRSRAGGAGYRPRSRSRDDLMAEPRRPGPSRQDRNYTPPHRRGSWGSASDDGSRRGAARGPRGGGWSDYPPSYSEYEPGNKPGKRPERFSDKSSRSGNSIVI